MDPECPRPVRFVPIPNLTVTLMLLVGMNLVFIAAWIEQENFEPLPWRESIPVWVRRASVEATPDMGFLARVLALWPYREDRGDRFGLDQQALVIVLWLSDSDWRALLESGRLPTPGRFEALAGELACGDSFTLDGVAFTVTGRIRRGAPGFTFAYAVPHHENLQAFFDESLDAAEIRLGPDGFELIEEADDAMDTHQEADASDKGLQPFVGRIDKGDAIDPDLEEALFWAAFIRSNRRVALAVLCGLMLTVIGGAIAQVRFLRWLGKRSSFFSPIGEPLAARSGLLWGMHITHYGTAFGMMVPAWLWPHANVHIIWLIQGIFAHGELSHIGSAYTSGDILGAAWRTFYQNYVNQTLQWCILPSLVIPFVGVVKNLVSFALVGFAMAPVWAGTAARLTFHSLTMAVELEAYVLASFMVVLFPLEIARGLWNHSLREAVSGAARMMIRGSVLLGILLAGAALYEAATLILLD